ncbi:MAG TPA: sigma-70 family RNA polymerase sigma factor [Vicinamibacterales bacterium]|nr:sigma-70 family RNA polymerase sigma factor [Vicinamibacterales bacterium]
MSRTDALVDHLFRHQAGRIVARLTRVLGPSHIALVEETVQEALVRALQSWPYDGVPDNPAGWLYRVAHNLAIDAIRRDRSFGDKTDAIVAEIVRSSTGSAPLSAPRVDDVRDEELQMIFMCCHPDLPRDASVALSLKIIGGFSVREIARAFLADETAIAQRLVRAKRQIRDRRVTLDLPSGSELASRLDAVLDVIYFLFNEGYAAREGADLIRHDLCGEALRLGRLVASASLATPAVHALVALMAFQAARLPARVDAAGDLVLLEDQDRARWDDRLIAIGFDHFDRSMAGATVTEYHVQAAIAATHARAIDPQSLDWELILQLYDQLLAINPSAIVALNRAVAVAKVCGPAAALEAIAPLERDRKLREYHLLLALRGQLLLQLGRAEDALAAFEGALACAGTDPERRFLKKKLDAISACTSSSAASPRRSTR